MNLINKITFLLKKPKVVIIFGEGKKLTKEAILTSIKPKFKIGEEIFIFEGDEARAQDFAFFLKNSTLPVLVVTHVGEILPHEIVFAGERKKIQKVIKLAQGLPPFVRLILNYDDETVREIDDLTNLHTLTFGLDEKADFSAQNIKLNHGTNFKVSFEGKFIPVWLEGVFRKENIYAALAAFCVAKVLEANLVEVSENLREFKSLPGMGRLLEGIKESYILDDSQSATVASMIEAIEILGQIPGFLRKIAVLGDVVGVGKYTIPAHETIGEKVAQNADFLFTFGQRAKFIAKGAFEKGMAREKIFSFDRIEDGLEKLKSILRKGDLVLVDGSKEMKMSRIVDEIRKIW